jgi:PPK2 family polyphosphate:nucleotide phosphotransferase
MKTPEPNDFRISGTVDLSKIATAPAYLYSESDVDEKLAGIREKLAKIQEKMFAQNRFAVLICLQGMDTAGKDSLIREVFSGINPRGIAIHSFKIPTDLERQHDYLWRHYLALPEKGTIAVFNRTHYENVLVTRVHPEYILSENLPGIRKTEDITPAFWQRRMQQIVNFEKHLTDNGTIILKFFLHLGREEQRKRLLRRLDEEKHNWKFSPGDLKERERWDDYMDCYADALSKTSTPDAPWHAVPADDKPTCRYITAEIILQTLETFNIAMPEPDADIQAHKDSYRAALENEKQ